MNDIGFKGRLRGLMEAKGFQRKDLINLGFGEPRVDSWRGGGRKPSTQALRKIADWLEVSVDYLVGRRSDLDELNFREISVRESLDIFVRQEQARISTELRPVLERIAKLPIAPVTVAHWRMYCEEIIPASAQFALDQANIMRRMLKRSKPPELTRRSSQSNQS